MYLVCAFVTDQLVPDVAYRWVSMHFKREMPNSFEQEMKIIRCTDFSYSSHREKYDMSEEKSKFATMSRTIP
jgi:hypothetical protein